MILRSKDRFRKLKRRIGSHKVLDRLEDLLVYSVDASYTAPPGKHFPDLAVLPENVDDMIEIVFFAREEGLSIIPRGRGTGMSAGAVPINGGIVISTERMNRITEMNVSERWIQCEPGITTAFVKEAAAKHRLFYPPDPSSYIISSIGGNIAENAGGLRCVKYGTTKDYVLGLRYIDYEGNLRSTGDLQSENSTFDLTPILIGSEGLFGIIVESRLALIPAPVTTTTILAHFAHIYDALDVIYSILPELVPSVCELMDKQVIDAIRQHDPYPFPPGTEAALLLESDGDPEAVKLESDRIIEVLEEYGALEIHSAQNPEERERLWNLRRLISPALSRIADGKMNEDVVVPIGKMLELINKTGDIANRFKVSIPIYGHAGDGNIHLNVMYDKSDKQQHVNASDAIYECFRTVIKLGGTISGEHGIGAAKNSYMNLQFTDEEIDVFRGIKKAFDPENLFNPYKLLPPD